MISATVDVKANVKQQQEINWWLYLLNFHNQKYLKT